jgi:dihydrofolate synthase/folylpolyglutamate synthase
MVRMPHWPQPVWNKHLTLGLERLKIVLQSLDNPQNKMPNVIHFAGTNGKGSTISFVRFILEQMGKKVNVYTSPHLIRFNERMVIENKEIEDGYLFELMEQARIAHEAQNIDLTFFEGSSIGAFLAFANSNADYTLIETGMGGRFDATNTIENKILTVITPISLDHTDFLGNSLTLITKEKAEILRAEVPCIISQQYEEVLEELFNKVNLLQTNSFCFEYDYGIQYLENQYLFSSKNFSITFPQPALQGEHQIINAATAVATVINLPEKVTENHIRQGLASTKWIGRLQRLTTGSLANLLPNDKWQLWIDGAHNEAGAHILSLWVQNTKQPVYIIGGLTKGRDIIKFFSFFKLENVKLIAATYIENEPSSYNSEFLCSKLQELGFTSFYANSIEEIIKTIVHKEPGIILACGSLYLAGQVLQSNFGINY